MGGHEAGEVASRLALEALSRFIRRSGSDTDFSWPYGLDGYLDARRQLAPHARFTSPTAVSFAPQKPTDEYNGMGTTIVGVLMNGDHVAVGHVGRQPWLLLRGGVLEQVTQDDSWVAPVLAHNPKANPKTSAPSDAQRAHQRASARETGRCSPRGSAICTGDTCCSAATACTPTARSLGDENHPRSASPIPKWRRETGSITPRLGSRDNVTALVIRYEAWMTTIRTAHDRATTSHGTTGGYRLFERLGGGTTSAVYAAARKHHQAVALKLLAADLQDET